MCPTCARSRSTPSWRVRRARRRSMPVARLTDEESPDVRRRARAASGGARTKLRRSLGLLEITAGGVGIIIGAGIYVLIGAATARAGATVWVAFLLAAVLSALSGLSYAELSSMFPSAAAEYEYTRHVFPGWLAFVVGWVMIMGLVVA